MINSLEHGLYLDGIGFSGYRSFKTLQRIGPLGRINVFIGQNNVGKSNVLRFLHTKLADVNHSVRNGTMLTMASEDIPYGMLQDHKFSFELGLNLNGPRFKKWMAQQDSCEEMIHQFLEHKHFTNGGSVAWFRYKPSGAVPCFDGDWLNAADDAVILDLNDGQCLAHNLVGPETRSDPPWLIRVLRHLSPELPYAPSTFFVRAIRDIVEKQSERSDGQSDGENVISGLGLIKALDYLQHPDPEDDASREKFRRLNAFVRTVLGVESAVIEIPSKRNSITVNLNGRPEPLPALGTGIQEVIILAAASTTNSNAILCLEEPETHLHPSLQRALIEYLYHHTTNQYFISSHSAHLIDTELCNTFHVRLENGSSTVEAAVNSNRRSQICRDLGYKPSDLVQSNCVIWVEGPSDRIYVNRWIKEKAPELREHHHYAVMTYGGTKIYTHMSGMDPEVSIGNAISLRRLNRHGVIIIDRDTASPDGAIHGTKQRAIDEFNMGPGFAWLTKGREVENYLSESVLRTVMPKGRYKPAKLRSGKYEYSWTYEDVEGNERKMNKVKLALRVAKLPSVDWELDLEERINQLVEFIRESNGIVTKSMRKAAAGGCERCPHCAAEIASTSESV